MISPIYQTDRVTLYHGDCLDVLPQLPRDSVDIIWTDPPYGNNNNDGDLIHRWEAALGQKPAQEAAPRPIVGDSPEEWQRLIPAFLDVALPLLKPDCCCCCCCCCGGGGPKVLFAQVANWIDERMAFDQAVIWDKGGLGMGWRYRRNYEIVMVSHRRGGKLKWEWCDSGPATANVVRIGKILPGADEHPTPKPIALIAHFLRLHGAPGDLVLDPFAGGGPTALAALALGLRCILIEKDPQWIPMILRRLRIAESQPGLFPVPSPPADESPSLALAGLEAP